MSTNNANLARRWFEEVWNQRRTDTIDELLPPEGRCHTDAGLIVGPEVFKEKMHGPLLAAFPDLRVELEDVLASGDQVAVRWRVTATHDGDGLGMRATGKRVSFRGVTWLRYEDGKMTEGWNCSRSAGRARRVTKPTCCGRSARPRRASTGCAGRH